MESRVMEVSEISKAISERNLIAFSYDGFNRIVEPHTLGVDARQKALLCGYQVAGGSRSGATEGWKFFAVDRIERVVVRPEKFASPRPEYRRDDGAFAEILAQL
jgi:predicted DNA-binding transcriptional regulator YafY